MQPGDIVSNSHHTEMYVGNGQNANFGNSPHSGRIVGGPRMGEFTHAFRPNFDVNPSGTIMGPSGGYDEEQDSIYGANGFIYQGVATLSGYQSGGTLGKWLFDTLLKILDWIIGILTYLIRVVIVGWTVIVERVFIDGIVNTVTGINNTAEPENPDEEVEEPLEDIGSEENSTEYISTGMQQVAGEVDKLKTTTSSKANVTVENIVFNRVPILDANFFNFETALTVEDVDAGFGEDFEVVQAELDENGIVYILKVSIAMWYYTMRILAVAAMLIVLLYLGMRLAFTTAAEGKAIYKEMLEGWVVGFILIFAMHYIMYAVILINEGLVSWIAEQMARLGGDEISLYQTVRSKAYEIKASTGWSGTIMYLVLVYYAIKFLLIYLKRYFTIGILAIFSPVVALSCAIEKINKGGKKATIYGTWLKDFIYTVLLQAAHALIYVVFVGTALKLTEESLMGIALSLVFLHFMSNAEEILRKIMSFTNSPSDIMNQSMRMPKLSTITMGAIGAKHIGKYYSAAFNGMVVKPGRALMERGRNAWDRIATLGAENTMQDASDNATIAREEIAERKAAKEKEERIRRKEQVKKAFAIAGKGVAGATGLVLGTVGLVVEPAVGLSILGKSASSLIDTHREINPIKGVKRGKSGKKYTFNGVRVKDERAAMLLKMNLDRDGISYTERNGTITAGATGRERRKLKRKYTRASERGAGRIITAGL